MWVSAALLVVMFVDTIITAFMLGKYKQLVKDVREAKANANTADEVKKVRPPVLDLSNDELLAAARTLIGTRDE